jgi:hypothetical protein
MLMSTCKLLILEGNSAVRAALELAPNLPNYLRGCVAFAGKVSRGAHSVAAEY